MSEYKKPVKYTDEQIKEEHHDLYVYIYRGLIGWNQAIDEYEAFLPDEDELRTIICKHTSEMLDNPDKHGIYPTSKFYNNLIKAIHKRIKGKE